ncbi:MAG TPA: protein kinase, partial [Candidatus Baltobacteraceae bacterium]|nr:protein kinase [Candidatus Baltobacteraceae bacterium]
MTERILNERYRLDGPIGEGGTAIVYCGTDTLLRRRVAVKVLRSSFSADADFVERFYHEAQHAAKLSHPNIVSVYDVGHQDEAYFIVMELVEGATLDAVIRSKGRFPEGVAIDIATQICNGLSYAHRQGVLHRDIKAANVLMTNDDIAKISDFGIARAVAEQTVELTEAGTVVGSVSYISPEQAQGRELTPASDLYSLGIVLYQMLCGELPFTGPSAVSIALKHVSEPAPRIEALNPSISPVLASVVHRLLEKDPKARFSSAGELAAALREARERVTTVSDRAKMLQTEARTRATTPPPRRSAHSEQRLEPARKSQDPSSPARQFGSFTSAGLVGLLAIVFVIA